MNHNYYTCDHCGKKASSHDDYTKMQIEMNHISWETDLCSVCFDELADLIGRFVSAGKEKDNNERES